MAKKLYTDELFELHVGFYNVIKPYLSNKDKDIEKNQDITKAIFSVIDEVRYIIKKLNNDDDDTIKDKLEELQYVIYNIFSQIKISSKIYEIKSQSQFNSKFKQLCLLLNNIITLIYSEIEITKHYEKFIKSHKNCQTEINQVIDVYNKALHDNGHDDDDRLELFVELTKLIHHYFLFYFVDNIDKDDELFKIMINLYLLDVLNIVNLKNNDNDSDTLEDINNLTLICSYFEPLIKQYKKDINKNIEEVNTDQTILDTIKPTIIDLYEYILTFINTHLIPFDLKLELYYTSDFQIFENPKFFEKYLIEHIKIYNPSPCATLFESTYVDMSDPKYNAKKIYDKMNDIINKQNYTIYHFSNSNKMYYYSIFYKINTQKFLNPTDAKNILLLNNFELHQCLIMNTTFKGNNAYKYGKYLHILNKILFPDIAIQKSNIICFVNKSKGIADELFDFLQNQDLFQTNTSSATPPSSSPGGVTQKFIIQTRQSKYLKYDNISFYINENEPDDHINLILKKFEDPPSVVAAP